MTPSSRKLPRSCELPSHRCLFRALFTSLILVLVSANLRAGNPAPDFVAIVNGKKITGETIQLQFYLDQLPPTASAESRSQLIQKLIDRELIRQFLEKRGVTADPRKLQHQLQLIQKMTASRDEKFEEVLTRLHLTPAGAEAFLALPLAWDQYVHSVVSADDIQQVWQEHREELDGTRVRAAQIVRILKPDVPEPDWKSAEELLTTLRSRIEAGELTFAAAAQEFSESPSGKKGGDMGAFEFHGRVDEAISRIAFKTPVGKISGPFRTRFGLHLLKVEERIPGQLSLEDAREEIIDQLSTRLWNEQVDVLRKQGTVKLKNDIPKAN